MAPGRLPGQEHADLAVVDLAGSAGVLTFDAHALFALLDEARLLDGQHRILLAQAGEHHPELLVAQGIGVPRPAPEQVLEAIRRLQARRFGQLPTVFAFHRAEQALEIGPGAAGLAKCCPKRWVVSFKAARSCRPFFSN